MPSPQALPAKDELGDAVDALYDLEPGGFTAARTALAGEARKRGDRGLAKEIGKLPRPSRAAYALNLLARRQPDDVARLLRLAESLREATERLAGAELRQLGATRQQLIAELTSAARHLVEETGAPLSDAAAQEVEDSLTAALLDEAAAQIVASGHLVRALGTAGAGEAEVSEAGSAPAKPAGKGSAPAKPAALKQAGKGPAPAKPDRGGSAAGDGDTDSEYRANRPILRDIGYQNELEANRQRRSPDSGDEAAKVRLRKAQEAARERLKEADETARRTASAAAAARKELDKTRQARDRAVTRRETAEAALLSARRSEIAALKALRAAEAAEGKAVAAHEAAERERARRRGSR